MNLKNFEPQLKTGQMSNGSVHRCRQTQCGFFLNGGCRACDDCAAAPYEINESCQRCKDCEGVSDSLRWGEKKLIQVGQKRQIPPEELLLMNAPEKKLNEHMIIER